MNTIPTSIQIRPISVPIQTPIGTTIRHLGTIIRAMTVRIGLQKRKVLPPVTRTVVQVRITAIKRPINREITTAQTIPTTIVRAVAAIPS